MRIVRVAVVGVLVGCSGGGASRSTTTTTNTTVALGNDRAATPFCVTLGQITKVKDAKAHPAQSQALVDRAVDEAPASLHSGLQSLAAFLRGSLAGGPTTTLSQADGSRLLAAVRDLGTYATAHCGIVLHVGA
ncbi:MAG: hypothetical protein ACYDH6_00580 [Acidimicrobiales bacterium]